MEQSKIKTYNLKTFEEEIGLKEGQRPTIYVGTSDGITSKDGIKFLEEQLKTKLVKLIEIEDQKETVVMIWAKEINPLTRLRLRQANFGIMWVEDWVSNYLEEESN